MGGLAGQALARAHSGQDDLHPKGGLSAFPSPQTSPPGKSEQKALAPGDLCALLQQRFLIPSAGKAGYEDEHKPGGHHPDAIRYENAYSSTSGVSSRLAHSFIEPS